MARNTITQLLERDERLTKAFDESLAYMVVDMKVTKIPAVGVGGGEVTVHRDGVDSTNSSGNG